MKMIVGLHQDSAEGGTLFFQLVVMLEIKKD